MSYVPTSRKAYKRHKYSGPRKSLKRVRGGLRQFYGEDSCLKVWRSEENKKKPVNEEIVIDNSIVTPKKQPRTYERVKPKICLEDTYSSPCASTVKVDPLEINRPQADPEPDSFKTTVETASNICLSGISGYHIVHYGPKTYDPLDKDEEKLRIQCEERLEEFQNSP